MMMPLYGFVFADYSARGLFRAPQLFFFVGGIHVFTYFFRPTKIRNFSSVC